MVDTSNVIESQVHIDLHGSIHSKSSANEVDGCDRRMMTDLLQDYRTSSYLTLIGLT